MINIIELIPSRDLREALREEDRRFTDMETATLIHNLWLPSERRRELLQQLMEETQDERLRAQINYSLAEKAREEDNWPSFLFFEDRWIDLPMLYDTGDFVRVLDDCNASYIDQAYDWAVVDTSREKWEPYRERVNAWLADVEAGRKDANGMLADFSDMQVTVEFPCKDGTFIHDHINPMFLERVTEEAPEGSEEAELRQVAHYGARGEVSLDWLSRVLKKRILSADRMKNKGNHAYTHAR